MAELSTLARPYAKAAFDYAYENSVIGEWEDFLFVASSVVSDSAFVQMLENPAISTQNKVDAIVSLYNDQVATTEDTPLKTLLFSNQRNKGKTTSQALPVVSAQINNFVTQLAAQERLSLLPQVYEQFSILRASKLKQIDAYITSAYPLNDSQRKMIQDKLADTLHAEVILHETVDQSLMAGATIKIGDKLVDDSMRGKLKQLKTQLTA